MWDWLGSIGGFLGDAGKKLLNSETVSNLFSTDNILGGLGAFANVYSQQEKQHAAEEASKAAFDQQVALLNIKHQQDIEMAKLAASLKGGGGGGGHPDYEGIEKLRQLMAAKELQVTANQAGANATVEALKNLMEGAQAPILRR